MLRNGSIIAVEGISGVGKSRLSQWLALRIPDSRWYFEMEPSNPVLPGSHGVDIIESASVAWQNFSKSELRQRQISIFDGRLLMVSAVVALRSGLSPDSIASELLKLVDGIAANGLTIVHLKPAHIEAVMENSFRVRSALNWYISDLEASEFARKRSLRGKELVIEFYRTIEGVLSEVSGSSGATVIKVPISAETWNQTYLDISKTLGITDVSQVTRAEPNLEQYCGRFEGTFRGSSALFVISVMSGRLQLTEHPYTVFQPVEQTWTLHQTDRDTFVALGQPVKLLFARDGRGKVVGLESVGMYDTTNRSDQGPAGETYFERCEG